MSSTMLSFAWFLFLLPHVLALPTAESTVIEKRDIPNDVYNNLVLFSQFAAASYCPVNGNSPNTKIVCPEGSNNCPLVEADDTFSVAEFSDTQLTDATGYVAYDNTRKLTVVVFRGSHSLRNLITDTEFAMTPTSICGGCDAHFGFLESWGEARDAVLTAVKAAADAHPDYALVVTGHSLGAAIATLCAAELRNDGYKAALYTYGSPRVGNWALANYITNQPGGNFRVTHTNDPIPHLPLLVMGFQHVQPEYFINAGNNEPAPASKVTELPNPNDWRGNTGQFFTDIFAHLWYFQRISACGGSEFEF